MFNPFVISGPTCLSFSMGRTSGYMVRRVLDANSPEVLRENLRVLTCNTGKEMEESLAFGDRIDREWLRPLGLSITWLEYRQGGMGTEIIYYTPEQMVDYARTAISRWALDELWKIDRDLGGEDD